MASRQGWVAPRGKAQCTSEQSGEQAGAAIGRSRLQPRLTWRNRCDSTISSGPVLASTLLRAGACGSPTPDTGATTAANAAARQTNTSKRAIVRFRRAGHSRGNKRAEAPARKRNAARLSALAGARSPAAAGAASAAIVGFLLRLCRRRHPSASSTCSCRALLWPREGSMFRAGHTS